MKEALSVSVDTSELWEDFYDVLIAKRRKDEPRESLESVNSRLHRSGKLNAEIQHLIRAIGAKRA
jgi:hypothetical protein